MNHVLELQGLETHGDMAPIKTVAWSTVSAGACGTDGTWSTLSVANCG